MNLLIISGTAHYRKGATVTGWGPTVEEIDHLATLFSRVVHIAPLHASRPSAATLAYVNPNVQFVAIKPSGGRGWLSKAAILLAAPSYVRAMLRHLRQADAVHVRCPSNIGLLAIVLLAVVRNPARRWAKYAGEWLPCGREAWSYRFQRWWLRRGFSRSFVTINGVWGERAPHLRSFRNPSLTVREVSRGQKFCAAKKLTHPLRLLCVGRLSASKGAGRAIEVLARVLDAGFDAVLDIAGDGPERRAFERLARERDVAAAVRFHGWLGKDALNVLYGQGHITVLPSESEGWPKVLSEGMAYGVVPLASDTGSIPQVLAELGVGRCFRHDDIAAFVAAVEEYRRNPAEWQRQSSRATRAAELFTYERYLSAVTELLGLDPGGKFGGKVSPARALPLSERSDAAPSPAPHSYVR